MPDIHETQEQLPSQHRPVTVTDGTTVAAVHAGDQALQVRLTNPGDMTIANADGAIADGADAAIRATVAPNATTPARKELAVADAAVAALVDAGNQAQATATKQDAQTTEITAVKNNTQNIFDRLLTLLGAVDPAPVANTVGDRLKAIWTRMADESQLAKGARVVTTAAAALADQGLHFLRLDQFGRLRVAPCRLDQWQTQVTRRAAFTTNSTTFATINNATAALAGYGAQNIEYTVPAGKTFYLTGLALDAADKYGADLLMVVLEVAGVPILCGSIGSNGASSAGWRTPPHPLVLPAGTVLTLKARVTGGTQSAVVMFTGYEE